MLEQPVLTVATTTRGSSTDPFCQGTFFAQLEAIIKSAGYHDRISIHAIQCGLANVVDSKPCL